MFENIKRAWAALWGHDKGVSLNDHANLLKFLGLDGANHDCLSEATYFACLKVLSEALGKLPCKIMQHTPDNGVSTMRKHPLYKVLHDRPNPYMTASTFWSTFEYNRNHYGNAYALIHGAGSKTTLWILPSDRVTMWYDDAKILSKVPNIWYLFETSEGILKFSHEEILHMKASNTFDGVEGIPVREQLQNTIKGNQKAQKMLNGLYDSGFSGKAVLNYTGALSDTNVQTLIAQINKYVKGELKAQGIENIIPIPFGFSLSPLNAKLADSQFIEIKQYSALQIASAFGIKPNQIGDYTKSSYASAEAQQLSFYVDTLLYIIKQYEEELSYKLLSDEERQNGFCVKFNVNVILRADLKTQIDTLSTAVNSFIYTPNEARALLDMPCKDGGDRLLGNGASIPVELTGSQYTGAINGEGGRPDGKRS